MIIENIKFTEGAHKTYPQLDKISSEMTAKFKEYHEELRKQGYSIRAINIASKEKALYWIILNENGECQLELYGHFDY